MDVEDEANYLAGALLITEPATLAIAKGRWTTESALDHFGVSSPMLRMRMNATGAYTRMARARGANKYSSTR